MAVTTLKFRKKKFEYHTSNINGALKEVNTKIEELVGELKIDMDHMDWESIKKNGY